MQIETPRSRGPVEGPAAAEVAGPAVGAGAAQPPAPRAPEGVVHRTLAGLFWMFLGTGFRGLVQLLVLAVLARLLTVAQFGVITAGVSVTSFAVNLSGFGIGSAVVQFADLQTRHLRTAFAAALFFGAASTALIWGTAPSIAAFFRIDALTPVLRVLSLVCLIRGAGVVAEGLLQRQMRFRLLAGIDVATYAVAYGIIGIGLAVRGYGVWAFVAAYLALAVARMVLVLATARHPVTPMVERRALSELLHFGAGLSLGKAGNYVATEGDNVVVGRWLGPEALGLYGRVYQLMAMPAMFMGEILDNVLFPGMARLREQPMLLRVAYRRAVALVALMALPISAVLLVLAPEIIHVLLGPKWLGAVVPFQIFAFGMFFRTGYKISDATVRAEGAVYRRAWRQTTYALLVLGGAWAGQRWGLRGVAIGVTAAIAVNFVLMAELTLSLTGLSRSAFCKAHGPGSVLAGILGLELWAVAAVLRGWGASSLAVLGVAACVIAFTLLVGLRWMPSRFLGRDGHWMLKTLAGYLPERFKNAGWLRADVWVQRDPGEGRDGRDSIFVVEFAGLPGVGKSTLTSRVAHLLRQAGVPVDEPRRRFAPPRLVRFIKKTAFVMGGILRRPGYAVRSASAILASRQQSVPEILRELHNWLFVSSCLYRPRGSGGVRLLDQGVFQALWGIGYGADDGALEGVLHKLTPVMPRADVVVLLEARLPVVKRRLAVRQNKWSRMDRVPPDAHDLFAKALRSLAEVKDAIVRASTQTPAISCIIVDNNREGESEAVAAQIVHDILRLYATRHVDQLEHHGVDLPRYVEARG